MNDPAVIDWLNSPESDEWRQENFSFLGFILKLKEDVACGSVLCGTICFDVADYLYFDSQYNGLTWKVC